jgi:hypothetical protein
MKLNDTARATLRDAGVSPAVWARANFEVSGKWSGDVCGCPDQRCANGFHHMGEDDCGCLGVLLDQYLAGEGIFDDDAPPPRIWRLNGRPYQPRKLTACPVTDEDEITAGVVVFGTHDPARAQDLADGLVHRDVGRNYAAASPERVWWRDGFEGGRRGWVTDEEHGRAGVFFREIVEVATDGPDNH